MTRTHTKHRSKRAFQAQVLTLGVLAVVSSFAIGVRTAGDVETVSTIEAGGTTLHGEMNADAVVDIRDAILLLEIAQGYDDPTPEQLLADPNGDGTLTVEDAIRILHDIASRL